MDGGTGSGAGGLPGWHVHLFVSRVPPRMSRELAEARVHAAANDAIRAIPLLREASVVRVTIVPQVGMQQDGTGHRLRDWAKLVGQSAVAEQCRCDISAAGSCCTAPSSAPDW